MDVHYVSGFISLASIYVQLAVYGSTCCFNFRFCNDRMCRIGLSSDNGRAGASTEVIAKDGDERDGLVETTTPLQMSDVGQILCR